MALKEYGLLKGIVVGKRKATAKSPHYQIRVLTDNGIEYRIAVNVKSKKHPSEVTYFIDDDFHHEIIEKIKNANFDPGFYEIENKPNSLALDYIRYNLFKEDALIPLPFDVSGPNNDLNDFIDHFIVKAKKEKAVLYAFGEPWGPTDKKDTIFKFFPSRGIHDIHMNQGNAEPFTKNDGVWQDGGLLLHFESSDKWLAYFTAFQSQSMHTDDTTGNRLEVVTTRLQDVVIFAALVNPEGDELTKEQVYLLNLSGDQINLDNWSILDKTKQKEMIDGTIRAFGTKTINLSNARLSNKGGIITLLDENGVKVDGVSYSKAQARKENYLVKF